MQSPPSATGKHEISLSPEVKEALMPKVGSDHLPLIRFAQCPTVKERVVQLEVWLNEAKGDFRNHMQSILSDIPPTVRGITMRDLVDKYGGNVKACAEALAIENCKHKCPALLTSPTITP